MIGVLERIEEIVEPQTQTSGSGLIPVSKGLSNQLNETFKLNMIVLCDLGDVPGNGDLPSSASVSRPKIRSKISKIPGVVESFAMTGTFGTCVHIQANTSIELGKILRKIQALSSIARADGYLVYENDLTIYPFPPMTNDSASCFTLVSVEEGKALEVVTSLKSVEGIYEIVAVTDIFYKEYKYNMYVKMTARNGTDLGKLLVKIQVMPEVYGTYSSIIY